MFSVIFVSSNTNNSESKECREKKGGDAWQKGQSHAASGGGTGKWKAKVVVVVLIERVEPME